MKEFLFGNTGSKIKTYAAVLFIIETVCCIYLAFKFGMIEDWGWIESRRTYDTYYDFNILFFFWLLMIIPSYIFSLFVYGFGVLLDNTHSINDKITDINNKVEMNPKTIELKKIENALKF